MVATRQAATHISGLSLAAAATVYAPVGQTLLGSGATEAIRQWKWAEAGTFDKLRCKVLTNGVTATSTFTFRDNGSDTSLAVAYGSGVTGVVEDLSNSDAVTGSTSVAYGLVAGGTGTTLTIAHLLVDFTPTASKSVTGLLTVGTAAFSTASVNRYLPPAGRGGTNTSTESRAAVTMRVAGTARNFQARMSANARSTTSTFRVRKNSANGGGVVTFGSGATGLAEDTTNSDTFASGDTLNYSYTTGSGSGSQTHELLGCFFDASTSGEQPFINGSSSSSTGNAWSAGAATRYTRLAGDFSSYITAEATTQTPEMAGTFDRFRIYVATNTKGTACSATLRKNGADAAQTVAIGAGVTGLLEDTTNSDYFAAGDLSAIKWVFGTDANTIAVGWTAIDSAIAASVPATASASFGGTFSATSKVTKVATAAATFGGVLSASASSGGSVSATATASFGGTFSAAAVPRKVATASASFGGSFSATSKITRLATASVNLGGTFAAAAVPRKVATASASFGGVLSVVASTTHPATASGSFGGTFAASASVKVPATAAAVFGGTFSATAVRSLPGSATASLGGTFAATAVVTHPGSATASFGGSFSASAVPRKVATGAAAFGGVFAAAAVTGNAAAGSASFGGSFTASAVVSVAVAASASFGGSFSALVTVTISASAAASFGGVFSASTVITIPASAVATFGGTFAVTASVLAAVVLLHRQLTSRASASSAGTREPDNLLAGEEPATELTERASRVLLDGRSPASGLTGREAATSLSGREQGT